MLKRKFLRTILLYKAQFISMFLLLIIGIGVFIGFNIEHETIRKNYTRFFKETHFADLRMISEQGFSESDLAKVERLKGVKRAGRYISINVGIKERKGDTLDLTVTENAKVSGVKIISGKKYDSRDVDGIWISDRYAKKNKIKIGEKITMTYSGKEMQGKVKGLIKSGEHMICLGDSMQIMPDYTSHGYCYISPSMYKKNIGTPFYPQINVITNLSKGKFTEKAEKTFGKAFNITDKDENHVYAETNGEIEEGKTMGTLIPLTFLIIAVLNFVTTMHRMTAKEKLQIGTLKAIGFKEKTIVKHYLSYGLIIGLAGSAGGIGLGYGVAYYIMNPKGAMGTYLDMPYWRLCMPWFCYLSVASFILLLTLIGYISAKKMLKGTAADALRSQETKAIRASFIEKTAFFQKLGFATKWNLRDSLRHKFRTTMSIFGVACCATVLIASRGMKDSYNGFLDSYYEEAMNYKSQIMIAENADPNAVKGLIKKYEGDYNATLGVELNSKATELEICDNKKDLRRIIKTKSTYQKLGNSGAYICRKIADRTGLRKGDFFKVKVYGTDKTYKLKVSGVIKSVNENVIITPKYANKLGIKYRITSIYTKQDKSKIKQNPAIEGVISKRKIISSFDIMSEMMTNMVGVINLFGAILGLIVLYNLGLMCYIERYRELATLKVLGFRNRKLGKIILNQNMAMTVIGTIIGIPVGYKLLDYCIKKLVSEYEMTTIVNTSTYVITVIMIVAVTMVVSLMLSFKNRKIDMVESLKSAE